jgi:hypothetical protein
MERVYLLGAAIVAVAVVALTGSAAFAQTGTANVTVASVVSISLPVNTIDFGTMNNGETDDTTDGAPAPFTVQNDGTVQVNVTIAATSLFSGTGGPSPSTAYQYQIANSTEGTLAWVETCSDTAWTNMPTTAEDAICFLNFTDATDMVEVEIKVTVPNDEPAGFKSSTVTFTASQA